MDLQQALLKHVEWETRFRVAIFMQERMDEDNIGRDDCCELGKWLHGPGQSRFGHLSVYQTCLSRHAILHLEAAKIAGLVNRQQFSQAEQALDDGAYAVAASAASVAIEQLRQQTEPR
ncbi:CZB domain-containing protein [Chromobacterium subtsugae]|uniref:CZB domain-containing protein n=1 Tax=Chromobacterium subtsugae TaxID=251747 RepID=A0ABS7FEL4_9NEIS|nr:MULTISPECIES: CZB domain-containing protein [Chromobacterium]KUM04084.1 hypothetical protein Cv017_16350 [Chromobacterium subtsugae]KZE85099.1 hypothetical protein AWB61_21255 [Chromobacterium sp. F49]MBW7568314.1 CZB domain-containing protein [Chromobacterium subtsugae]MBW8288514.1 CZB domain-containing protein [Chromobacterium subtsugae]OBU86776.1 hypothetical protein MY55_08090 [Chromobacterium subtsugae]